MKLGVCMDFVSKTLFHNERAALIDALRRDAQCERTRAARYPEWAEYHLQNARMNVRIIEAYGCREEKFDRVTP
ncbi:MULTISPECIES: hypothetical protein [unclassified Massilia]|uniref:hypothetical protein n=1 Tax=unclassified Massilia TaxID=2609279 RepID=UPI000AE3C9C4|nr:MULTISPECIES: hypothetical protein [unclassified Massilia]